MSVRTDPGCLPRAHPPRPSNALQKQPYATAGKCLLQTKHHYEKCAEGVYFTAKNLQSASMEMQRLKIRVRGQQIGLQKGFWAPKKR